MRIVSEFFQIIKMTSFESPKEKVSKKEVLSGKLLIPKSASVEDILENLTLSGRIEIYWKKNILKC